MVEAGGEEGWLVGHVIIVFIKEKVESLEEGVCSSTGLYQSRHVVGDIERILL
jgi:hypothetical protein